MSGGQIIPVQDGIDKCHHEEPEYWTQAQHVCCLQQQERRCALFTYRVHIGMKRPHKPSSLRSCLLPAFCTLERTSDRLDLGRV